MLLEITAKKEYSHVILKNVQDKYDYLEPNEKAFMKRLCEGTLERMIQIDYILNQFSNVKVNKMKPVIRNILRMSVYQILFMDSVPDSAACNEAVKMAEKKKFHQLKGFVNGVLRNVARQKESIKYPDRKTDLLLFLSVIYSMPEWLVEKWMLQFGADKTENLLKGLLEEHPVTIRINELLSEKEKEEVLQALRKERVEVKAHPYLSYAFVLQNVEGIAKLPGFAEGKFTVQDISSMLVAEVSGVKKDDYVIDVCAAPGGKTAHIATKLRGTGHVEARDLTERKTEFISQNVKRLKLPNVSVHVADALVRQEESIEKADIVVADLPCSGLGIIGKKRDIKFNVSEESLLEIVSLQKEILSVIKDYVKKGGILLYSTCTIHDGENQEMMKWFCETFDFTMESIADYLPKELQEESTKQGFLQLLPGIHEADGFFFAKLRRNK